MALGLAVPFGSAYAQAGKTEQPQSDSGAACIERLEIPTYPPLASRARIHGTVTTFVLLSSEGSMQSIKTKVKPDDATRAPIFVRPVEAAVRQATFRPACGGQTVVIVFHFELGEKLKQSVMFGYPNTFWILAESHTAMP
jgi:TonB family protein